MVRAGARAARLLGVAARNPRALAGRFQYVFILSHMRAYTSLLAHILGSHPEISGYFELHQDYRGDFDLLRMRVGVATGLRYRLRGRYVLDKVLHSRHRIGARILGRPRRAAGGGGGVRRSAARAHAHVPHAGLGGRADGRLTRLPVAAGLRVVP